MDFSGRRRKSGDSLEENKLYMSARAGEVGEDRSDASSSPVTATPKATTLNLPHSYLQSPASIMDHASSVPEVNKLAPTAESSRPSPLNGSASLPRKIALLPTGKQPIIGKPSPSVSTELPHETPTQGSSKVPLLPTGKTPVSGKPSFNVPAKPPLETPTQGTGRVPLLPTGKKAVVGKPSPSLPAETPHKTPTQGIGIDGQLASGNGTLYINVADKSKTKKQADKQQGGAVRWAKSAASNPMATSQTTAPTQAAGYNEDNYEDVSGIVKDEYNDVVGRVQEEYVDVSGMYEDEYEDVREIEPPKGSHLIRTGVMPSGQKGSKEDDKECYEELPLL